MRLSFMNLASNMRGVSLCTYVFTVMVNWFPTICPNVHTWDAASVSPGVFNFIPTLSTLTLSCPLFFLGLG